MPYAPPEHGAGKKEAPPKHAVKRLGSTARGYNYRWQRFREHWLSHNPLCVECRKAGRSVEATDLDHIVPHKGDMERFWDKSNVQGLCASHHSEKTSREDGGWDNPSSGGR